MGSFRPSGGFLSHFLLLMLDWATIKQDQARSCPQSITLAVEMSP
jgi:hypothetical protein